MVGVPGRSKACRTCKRRKKGCDGQEPICGQCARAGILCEGYDKDRIFVNSGQNHGNASRRRFMPESYAPPSLAKSKPRIPSRKPHAPGVSPALGESLALVAQQSQCFDNFWSSLLPNAQSFSTEAAQFSTAGWSGVVQELCQQDDLVRSALLANALGVLGEASGQHSITVQGWRVYGKVLQMMGQALPAKIQEKGDQLLTASMLLAQYELLHGSRGGLPVAPLTGRWHKHVFGEHAILLARGPERYGKGCAHQLFINSRLHLIYPSIRIRQRSPLSSPEWKSIPWTHIPKDPKNELLDIFVEIPTVLQLFDQLMECPLDQPDRHMSLHQSLEKRCWLHDVQLQQWSITSGQSTVDFVESQILLGREEASMPSSVHFAKGHLGLLYWTTCFLLYQNIYQLNQDRPQHLPARMEPRQYCRKIMLLMPYFQYPNMGMFFSNITGFSTVMVTCLLDQYDSPDIPSEERILLMAAFGGKYQRKIGNHLEHFTGTNPWRNENWKSRVGMRNTGS